MLLLDNEPVQAVRLPVSIKHPNPEGRFRSRPKTCMITTSMITTRGSKTI
jgi:hypothetical protein